MLRKKKAIRIFLSQAKRKEPFSKEASSPRRVRPDWTNQDITERLPVSNELREDPRLTSPKPSPFQDSNPTLAYFMGKAEEGQYERLLPEQKDWLPSLSNRSKGKKYGSPLSPLNLRWDTMAEDKRSHFQFPLFILSTSVCKLFDHCPRNYSMETHFSLFFGNRMDDSKKSISEGLLFFFSFPVLCLKSMETLLVFFLLLLFVLLSRSLSLWLTIWY